MNHTVIYDTPMQQNRNSRGNLLNGLAVAIILKQISDRADTASMIDSSIIYGLQKGSSAPLC
jgi:hypothetical protein